MFDILYRYISDWFPGITCFSWNYSKQAHSKGALDGVDGTLKIIADKAVAEGKDIVNLGLIKDIVLSRCSSIMLFELPLIILQG